MVIQNGTTPNYFTASLNKKTKVAEKLLTPINIKIVDKEIE
jgi:hypothetical protein